MRLYLLRVPSYLGRVDQMREYLPRLVREAEDREDRYSIVNLRAVGGHYVALATDDRRTPSRRSRTVESVPIVTTLSFSEIAW
jgi:hypothetical protein